MICKVVEVKSLLTLSSFFSSEPTFEYNTWLDCPIKFLKKTHKKPEKMAVVLKRGRILTNTNLLKKAIIMIN